MAETVFRLSEDEPDPLAEKIAGIFGDEHAEGDTVWVYALDEHGKNPSKVWHFPAKDLGSEAGFYDDVEAGYGVGHYAVEVRNELGHKKARLRFTIGSDQERRRARLAAADPASPSPAVAPAAAAPAPKAQEDVPPVLAAILENQQKMIATLLESAIRPAEKRDSRADLLAELTTLKSLFGGDGGGGGLKGTLTLVKDVADLLGGFGAGGASESPLASAARHLAPTLTKLVEKIDLQPAPQQGAGAQPQGAPAQQSQQQQRGGAASMNMGDWVQPLVQLAEAKATPTEAAERVLDELDKKPGWVFAMAVSMIHTEPGRAKAYVLALAPALEQHQEWVDQVMEQVRVSTADDPEGDAPHADTDDTPAGAGNATAES